MIDKEKLLKFVQGSISIQESIQSTEVYKFLEMKIRKGYFDIEYNIVDHLPSILKRIQDDIVCLEEKIKPFLKQYKKIDLLITNKDKSLRNKVSNVIRDVDIIEKFLNERFDQKFEDYRDEKIEFELDYDA